MESFEQRLVKNHTRHKSDWLNSRCESFVRRISRVRTRQSSHCYHRRNHHRRRASRRNHHHRKT